MDTISLLEVDLELLLLAHEQFFSSAQADAIVIFDDV